MKVSKLFKGLTALAVVAALPAHAGYVVMDGVGLDTPTTSTTNIGRLNLVSGSATVEQELNGTGNVFVGAKFREDGAIYSISYTKENVVGAGDIGVPLALPDSLTLAFSNVTGVVTGLNASGFSYAFLTGSYTIAGIGGLYGQGSIVGIGGNGSSTSIIGGFNGDSTLLSTILSATPGFDIKDSGGNSLLPQMAAGSVLFETVTNNNLTNVVNTGQTCSFAPTGAGNLCSSFNVASAGDAYVVQAVPEPGALALVGLGLFGVAVARRNRKA